MNTWPDPTSVSVKSDRYLTPEGTYPRVTHALDVLGLGKNALIGWAADLERESVLEACAEVYMQGLFPESPADFVASVQQRITGAKAHVKKLREAGEIGTSIHEWIQWTLKGELGLPRGPEPPRSDEALLATMWFEDFWKAEGLKPLRIEQPVWHPGMGYAGTIDLIAEGPQGLEILDWKTGKGIYEQYHLQVAAYAHAARQYAPIVRSRIVRFPKALSDPGPEIRELGDMTYNAYRNKHGKMVPAGGQVLPEEDLLRAFAATLEVWKLLVQRKDR